MNCPCSALSLLMTLSFGPWVGLAEAQTFTAPRHICHNYCDVVPHVDGAFFDFRPRTVTVELAPEVPVEALDAHAPTTAGEYAEWYDARPVKTARRAPTLTPSEIGWHQLFGWLALEAVQDAFTNHARGDDPLGQSTNLDGDYDGYDEYGYGISGAGRPDETRVSADPGRDYDGGYDHYGYDDYCQYLHDTYSKSRNSQAIVRDALWNRAEHDPVYDREVYGIDLETGHEDGRGASIDLDVIRAVGQAAVAQLEQWHDGWRCEAHWQVARLRARVSDYWYESGMEQVIDQACTTWRQHGVRSWFAGAPAELPGTRNVPITSVDRSEARLQLLRTLARGLSRASDWLESASDEVARMAETSVAEQPATTR